MSRTYVPRIITNNAAVPITLNWKYVHIMPLTYQSHLPVGASSLSWVMSYPSKLRRFGDAGQCFKCDRTGGVTSIPHFAPISSRQNKDFACRKVVGRTAQRKYYFGLKNLEKIRSKQWRRSCNCDRRSKMIEWWML